MPGKGQLIAGSSSLGSQQSTRQPPGRALPSNCGDGDLTNLVSSHENSASNLLGMRGEKKSTDHNHEKERVGESYNCATVN